MTLTHLVMHVYTLVDYWRRFPPRELDHTLRPHTTAIEDLIEWAAQMPLDMFRSQPKRRDRILAGWG
jgi:hypothetical protein